MEREQWRRCDVLEILYILFMFVVFALIWYIIKKDQENFYRPQDKAS
jgi:hypothetical protein